MLKLATYGGNNCDFANKNCDCFCCNWFGLRGYEACEKYGLYIGAVVGIIIGLVIYIIMKNIKNKQ
jgi:hypothetical protein